MSSKAMKDLRSYSGAAGIFVIVIGLLFFLAFNEIPQLNKDVFVSIVGMISGSLAVIIYTIIGRNPDEVIELQKKNDSLETKLDTLITQKDSLEAMIIKLQDDLLDKMFLSKALDCDEKNCKCKT